MKHKNLTFEERVIIEEYLNNQESVHHIALRLNRSDSSIVREIKRNRYLISNKNTKYIPCRFSGRATCTVRHLCGDEDCTKECQFCFDMCGTNCPDYVAITCVRLDKSPYVCNGCKDCDNKNTRYNRYKYSAKFAQSRYEIILKTSRQGIAISKEEMENLDNIVSPLLFNGQSIGAIYMTHEEELPCSKSTLYRYVNNSYLTARNIDMPRKVRFKKRHSHGSNKERTYNEFVIGRTFKDYQEYTSINQNLNIWQMDTVIGTPGGKCLLTLLFCKSTFMIAILLDHHTQENVILALNSISERIGIENFQRLFQVILTDRGVEFSNPYALECDENGEIKTRVFYCDPYCSWQKGAIERNHEFIRMVLPKGKTFDNLSQSEIHLLMTHINNYPRESLNGSTPYELSKYLLGQEFLSALKFHKIRPDDVILKPSLLRKPSQNN